MEAQVTESSPIVRELLSEPLEPGAAPEMCKAWQRVETILRENFHNPDIEAAKALFACLGAHLIRDYTPVWPLLIAPPGSMKTVLLESLAELPRIHFADEVTPNTFISGLLNKQGKTSKKASLLHRIGPDGVLVSADFSTVLSGDPHKRLAVFAQLRRIFDGDFSQEFGTESENLEDRHWQGRLTFIAGCTPAVDDYHSVLQQLGERFVRIRWDRAAGFEAGLQAMAQTEALKMELREAVHAFLEPILSQANVATPILPYSASVYLTKLGEETCQARASVPRTNYGKGYEISGPPLIESNTRLPQQLAQVARGWALLNGRSEVDLPDLALATRVANDSIPPTRFALLQAHLEGRGPYSLGLPPASVKRALEDLRCIGLLPPDASKLARMAVNDIPEAS